MGRPFDKVILFRLAGITWAMPVTEDSQFVSFDKIVKLPIKNENVAGLIYNSGRIITILKADKILNLEPSNKESSLCLIFYSHGDFYAICVDEGGETIDVPRIMTDKKKKTFQQYMKVNNQKVYLLTGDEIWYQAKI